MDETSFSIIIPCHNEATVIDRKLENCMALSGDCPVEVLVVDDHSTDGTYAMVAEHLRKWPAVRLLTNRYRPGKNGALKTAFEETKGSLYLITDADILLDSDTLEKARLQFESDSTLGALCLSPRITSPDRLVEIRYVSAYETFNRRLKMLQSRLDSVPILHGQAMFVRACLEPEPHDDLPGDDIDFAFQVRLQGSRVRYQADLPFYEEISQDRGRVFQQKVRRAKGVMRSFWRYRRVLFNPRYGLFGIVCFPLDFGFYFMLAPLAFVIGLVGSLWLVAAFGGVGAGIVIAVWVLLEATPAYHMVLWLKILMVSLFDLALEQRPGIRWMTQRY